MLTASIGAGPACSARPAPWFFWKEMANTPNILTLNGVEVEDTYAEAFPLACARVILTAETLSLVQSAAMASTGHASSVIGCDAEAGIASLSPR